MMSRKLTRRTFLRGSGVALGLPLLDGMLSVRAAAADKVLNAHKRRIVCICTTLGIHNPFLFPDKPGQDYAPTPYLDVLKDLRQDFTAFSGVSHPEVDGGHSSEASFLTAAPHPGGASFRNTLSIDQLAAEQLSSDTRFPYLTLGTGGGSLSWTRGGIRIPADERPSLVFAKLFLDGSAAEVRNQVRRLRDGQSILDSVAEQSKTMQQKLGPGDRDKLDEYFTSVRDLERRLNSAEEWAKKPKPKVDVPQPRDIADRTDTVGKARLMYDLIHLALQTDSSRLITFTINGTNLVPPIQGVTQDWHNLSHHGKDPDKLDMLKIIEREEFKALHDFLAKLKDTKEEGGNLLGKTMVLYGSNLGNSSSHDTRNMPIVLAGGPFKHGQCLAFDEKNNKPLANIFVAMLQALGLPIDRFGSSTGARLPGFENI